MDLTQRSGRIPAIAKIDADSMIFVPAPTASAIPEGIHFLADVANGAEVLYRVFCFSMIG